MDEAVAMMVRKLIRKLFSQNEIVTKQYYARY
jgi:hypothetical protein